MCCRCPVASRCRGWRGKEPHVLAAQSRTLMVLGPPDGSTEILLRSAAAFTSISSLEKALRAQKGACLPLPSLALCSPGCHTSPASTGELPVSGIGGISPCTGVLSDGHPQEPRAIPTCVPSVPAPVSLAETSQCLRLRAGGSLERGWGPALPHCPSGTPLCPSWGGGRTGDTPSRAARVAFGAGQGAEGAV